MNVCGTASNAQCKQPTITERLNSCMALSQRTKEIANIINGRLFGNKEIVNDDCQKPIEPYSIEMQIETIHERLEVAVKELDIVNQKLA